MFSRDYFSGKSAAKVQERTQFFNTKNW